MTPGTSHIFDLDGGRYRIDRFRNPGDDRDFGGSVFILGVLDGRRWNRTTDLGRDFGVSGRVILERKVS